MADNRIELKASEHKLVLTVDGTFFADYCYDEALFKPYFGPITDKEGNSFTRLDFTAREHPHHRSVFVAIGDINGTDMWNEPADCGIERNNGFTDIIAEADRVSFTANNTWYTHDMKPLLDESTTYTVYSTNDSSRILDMKIALKASYGKVNVGPTKEAGPLGVRMRDELRGDKGTGVITNAEGGTAEAGCWGKSSAWCDYTGTVDGVGEMGVCIIDNPSNERYPTAWHVRDYGLFAANNLYFKGGYTLISDETIEYRYRLIFHRNKLTKEQLDEMKNEYIGK